MPMPARMVIVLKLWYLLVVCGVSFADQWEDFLHFSNGAIPDDQFNATVGGRRLQPSHDNARKHEVPKCQKSFEPTCDMYSYVRFWNKEFHATDCYESPLRPKTRGKTPWAERKYVVFRPDVGGWNNIRMAAETVIIFAHATGRTLVLPPMMKFYLLNRNNNEEENHSTFQKFFDFSKISEGLDIISMDEFIDNVAKQDLLEVPFPNGLTSSHKGVGNYMKTSLWDYMTTACFTPTWAPDKRFVGFNITADGTVGPIHVSKYGRRFREMGVHSRTVIPYDTDMHNHRALFFPGDGPSRMLVHFYAYLYWTDFHVEQIYKRIVRDRLHYHDDIFCSAGRIIQKIHHESAGLTHKPMPRPAAADPKTLGGNTNQDATYFAYHIRRGDFQYKETRISAEQIWANTKHLLDPAVTTLIYIATDETNRTFFEPFMRTPYTVRFLDSYLDLTPQAGTKLNLNHVGMMEQVICANAHTFIGTPYSTFTGYITRMRGYYRDGRYAKSYYTGENMQLLLQKKPFLSDALWGREFAKAHTEADDFWQ